MITATENLKNIFKNNTSIKTEFGCTIEYNLNSMAEIDSDNVVCTPTQTIIKGQDVFKKLFPVDTVNKSKIANDGSIIKFASKARVILSLPAPLTS